MAHIITTHKRFTLQNKITLFICGCLLLLTRQVQLHRSTGHFIRFKTLIHVQQFVKKVIGFGCC